MINNETIKEAFSKKDKKKLWVAEALFAMSDLDEREVFSWIHKSGHLGYMVLKGIEQGLSGIILERAPMKDSRKVCMCDFCLSVYNVSKMSRFIYRRSKTEMVSHYLCSGLDCVERMSSADSNEIHSMRETLSREERLLRYYDNVKNFWEVNVND